MASSLQLCFCTFITISLCIHLTPDKSQAYYQLFGNYEYDKIVYMCANTDR